MLADAFDGGRDMGLFWLVLLACFALAQLGFWALVRAIRRRRPDGDK